MVRSVKAGRRITLNDVGLFSDGTAVKQVGLETFRLAREYVDDYVLVDTDAICAGIKEIGRASCRERVCQYVSISVVGVSLKKTKKYKYTHKQHKTNKTKIK